MVTRTDRPREWLVLSVAAGGDDRDAELTDVLLEVGGSAVYESDGRYVTYVRPPGDVAGFVERIRAALERVRSGAGAGLDWHMEPAQDWELTWRRGLRDRRVGERLIITPSWVTPDAGPDDVVIVIDPRMAFGTGEHASTRGALRLLERSIRGGERVLDAGTGSGVLAIAAARLGAASVLAVDLDADAVANATENVRRNGVWDRVEVGLAAVDDAFLGRHSGEFDVIAANILSSVLVPLMAGFHRALRPGGALLLAGILASEADDVREAATAAGFDVDTEDVEENWWSARCVKPGTRERADNRARAFTTSA